MLCNITKRFAASSSSDDTVEREGEDDGIRGGAHRLADNGLLRNIADWKV